MLSNLEQFVQLHESVEIMYVVDGYVATYGVCDGNPEREVKGDTIMEALQNLQASLMDRPPEFRRVYCAKCRGVKRVYDGQVMTCPSCGEKGR